MPTNKDFKRLVRRRMHKTRESYTSARAQLLEMGSSKTRRTTAPVDYAKLAGMSDTALKAKTFALSKEGDGYKIIVDKQPKGD